MSVSLFNRLLVAPIPYRPKTMVWQLSRRQIAGTDLEFACTTVHELNAADRGATVDVLGEDSAARNEVETARNIYFTALAGINRNNLNCNILVELSDLGVRLEPDSCFAATRALDANAPIHCNHCNTYFKCCWALRSRYVIDWLRQNTRREFMCRLASVGSPIPCVD